MLERANDPFDRSLASHADVAALKFRRGFVPSDVPLSDQLRSTPAASSETVTRATWQLASTLSRTLELANSPKIGGVALTTRRVALRCKRVPVLMGRAAGCGWSIAKPVRSTKPKAGSVYGMPLVGRGGATV
jgi:hypothetical protein